MITANMRYIYERYGLKAGIFRKNYFKGHLLPFGFDYTSTVKEML